MPTPTCWICRDYVIVAWGTWISSQRVLDKFEQRLPEELAELERVLELGDAAKIALVAHRIKGNSSNVSAAGLQQAAAEIEDLSRAGRVADIHAPRAELARAVAAVCRLPRDAPASRPATTLDARPRADLPNGR